MNAETFQTNKTLIAVFGLFAIVAIGAITVVASYVSNANYGNEAEKGIQAVYNNNKQILGQYTLKVQEAASVPEMYREDLSKVMNSALSARYGKDGSKAVFQWIKEHNIPFDSSMYVKIQQIVEAGRNEFQVAQTRLIDVKRVYETNLGYVWKGFWLKLAGYPKINLADYKTVTTESAEEAFKKGTDKPIKLR